MTNELGLHADWNRVSSASPVGSPTGNGVQDLYLDLLKKCLTRLLFPEQYRLILPPESRLRRTVWRGAQRFLARFGLDLVQRGRPDCSVREEGLDWPASAETMVGLKRLDNLQNCIVDVLRKGVPGDLMETGVWRGGASIFMRAVLKAYSVHDRSVWLADSFQGLPKPDPVRYPADRNDTLWQIASLAVSLDEVKANFRRYGLLDEQVRFLPGWFRATLPAAPVERLALLRLDGDMYESTILALEHLYPKLLPGGYLIIDDYALPNCQAAVDEFRAHRGISEKLLPIDRYAKFWQRSA